MASELLTVEPTETGFAAKVTGLTSEMVIKDPSLLLNLVEKYTVLDLPKSNLSDDALVAFLDCAGEAYIHSDQKPGNSGHHPTHPKIHRILDKGGIDWHFDGFFARKLLVGISMLTAQQLPSVPTCTKICDMVSIFRDLPEWVKEVVKDKMIHVDSIYYLHGDLREGKVDPPTDDVTQWPGVQHPMVQTNKKGQPYLCLGARSVKKSAFILGVDKALSDQILQLAWSMVDCEHYQQKHIWEKGSAFLWDNQGTKHSAPSSGASEEDVRVLHRIAVKAQCDHRV